MSNETRHAWAAGFLDGDGCFCMYRSNKKLAPTTRQLSISAANNSLAPLEELQSLFGGRVFESRKTVAGNSHWQWHLNNAQLIREAIPKILPYLIEKKEIAEVVFAFSVLVKRGSRTIDDDELALRSDLIHQYEELRA